MNFFHGGHGAKLLSPSPPVTKELHVGREAQGRGGGFLVAAWLLGKQKQKIRSEPKLARYVLRTICEQDVSLCGEHKLGLAEELKSIVIILLPESNFHSLV